MSEHFPLAVIDQLSLVTGEQITPEELKKKLYDYAPDYLSEHLLAQEQDGKRPLSNAFPTLEAKQEWDQNNPRQVPLVEAKWNEKIGIDSTNNFYIWFIGNPGESYQIDSPTSQATKPALISLVKLKTTDPAFFEACQLAARYHYSFRHNEARQSVDPSYEEDSKQRQLDEVVAIWTSELFMKQVTTYLLAEGLPQADINSLHD
jgi:hypothetical protein